MGSSILIISVLILSVFGAISIANRAPGNQRAGGPGELLTEITGNVLYTPILLDFESDGKIEIIVGSHDTIRCLEDPDGDGSWSERWSNRIGSSIHNSPNIADLEGDGEVEVLIISESADSLFAIDNNGNTKWQFNYRNIGGWSDCHSSVASGDLNMDGTLETIFSPQSSGTMAVISDNGNEDPIGGGSVSSGGWHSSPAIGDLDGNPTNLEYIHQGASGTIYAVRMGGAIMWQKNIFTGTTTNPSPAIGDLDQDGTKEVIVVSEASNQLYCLDAVTGDQEWSFNMQSGSMSSAALVDLDVDEIWEVIIGDTSGNLYCISDEGEQIWSVNLGADIKPSPAVADLDGDGLLEVVEVNNDGNCFAIDEDGSILWQYDTHEGIPTSSVTADPSPVIGDINSDGYLEVVFATGSGTLRALETDGQVPSSALPWPMFRYDREHTGFYNGTLEYGASITVDEEHTDTSLQSPLIHFIEPGATTQYNLTLTNVGHQSVIVGMFRDRFTLSTKNIPENWTATLIAKNVPINDGETVHEDPRYEDFTNVEVIEHIQLEERQGVDFTLEITAPKANVSFGDFAAIEAFAMSESDNNATDSITTTTFIDIIVDMSVNIAADIDPFTDQKISGISAGADKMLNIELTNTGNINDTYDIDIRSGIPSGWTVSFDPNDNGVHDIKDIYLSTSLFGNEDSRTSFPIYIHCPITAEKNEQLDITVTATSQISKQSKIETVTNEDTVILIVEETNLLSLEISDSIKKVDPGDTEAYNVVITNRGNSRSTVRLTVDLPPQQLNLEDDEKWIVYWEDSLTNIHTLDLRKHEPVPLKAIVECPAGAIAGTRIVMTIRAEDVDDPSVVARGEITAIVNEYYDYQLNFSKKADSLTPKASIKYEINFDENKDGIPEKISVKGRKVIYNFTMENIGNAQDQINIYIKDLPTIYWTGHFEEDGIEISNLILAIGEKRELSFVVFVPEDAIAGVYDLGISSRGKGDKFGESIKSEDDPRFRSVQITVFKVHDIEIKSLDRDASRDGMSLTVNTDPNSQGSFLFIVTNKGNCEDYVRISTGNFPLNWDVWFSSIANQRTGSLTENKIKWDFSESLDLVGQGEIVNYIYSNKTDFATFKLDIDQSVWITLNSNIPRAISDENISTYINVSAWDDGDEQTFVEKVKDDNQINILYLIDYAELLIIEESLTYENNMKDGMDYSISIRVSNIGDIHAENVETVLKIDGEETYSMTIEVLGSGQNKFVSFPWTAKAGNHELEIIIDPIDEIVELNDQTQGVNNNVVKKKFTVEDKAIEVFGISAGSWAVFGGIVALGAGAIVAGGVLINKMKK